MMTKNNKNANINNSKDFENLKSWELFPYVIQWLFDRNRNIELPDLFFKNKNTLDDIVNYQLYKVLFYQPQLLLILNKNINNKYRREEPEKILILLKEIINQNNLYQTQCLIPSTKYRENIDKNFEELFYEFDRRNIGSAGLRSLYYLNQYLRFTDKHFSKKVDQLSIDNKNIKDKDDLDKINKLLKLQKNEKLKDMYLTELTQEIIDREKLTVFDVRKINNTEILFIFIDKDNKKVYYNEPLKQYFYLSNHFGIINNDYIEDYDPSKFSTYFVNNFSHLQKIKNSLKENFDRCINFI